MVFILVKKGKKGAGISVHREKIDNSKGIIEHNNFRSALWNKTATN